MKNTYDLVATALRAAPHTNDIAYRVHCLALDFGKLKGVTTDAIKSVVVLAVDAHRAGDDVKNFRAMCDFIHTMAFHCGLQAAYCGLAKKEIALTRGMWIETSK